MGTESVIRVLVRRAEEGGFWGEAIDLPGCASQGETLDELRENILDAIKAYLETTTGSEADRPDLWELSVTH